MLRIYKYAAHYNILWQYVSKKCTTGVPDAVLVSLGTQLTLGASAMLPFHRKGQ